MSKKDYELIASVIKDETLGWKAIMNGPQSYKVAKRLAEVFADNLASTNPRFNRARFLVACGAETI